MNLADEVLEYKKHVANLEVDNQLVHIKTLENIQITVELRSNGYYVLSSTADLEQQGFDDLNQLLCSVSQSYRDSFTNELFSKLSKLSEEN
ncbi:hypothetical protein SteCoe_11937 [Stentor coeruleus]|uniref:GSKIP domain-containing protein n=1 Tax=Stentor coeruleus TaxID=5963 RepID=A0A1R2CC15_9CILI|nr:hypothetical protein SteCoe_11937 [Stentor coeruleus]